MKHRKKAEQTQAHEADVPSEAEESDGDESLDFSAIKASFSSFFSKVNIEVLVVALFLLFSMVLVFYVRMLPTALPVTDDWAAGTIQQNIRAQIAQSVDAQYPALPQANRNTLIDKQTSDLITQHQAEFDANKQQLSQMYKSYLHYTGDDGKEYTYLGDLDSYFWLRYMRNILRHGNTCDLVTAEGQCRDMYTLAPVGTESSFNPSFHVFAIFGLYKFITLFAPNYPLPATSYLVPVIVGILGVIPAFFIGRRLAGNVGGLFAAVIISIHPLLLSRSLGSDNDVWNVVLPLFIMWMAIESLEAKSTRGRVIFAALTGAFVALHSATWEGWWFIYLIILLGLIGYLAFTVLVGIIRKREREIWKDKDVQHIALIIGVFYIASFIFLILASHSDGYFRVPLNALSTSNTLDRAIIPDFWPNVLTTVAELNKSSLGEAIGAMGGKLFFFASLAGMLLLILPRSKRWHWQHYLLFAAGGCVAAYLVTSGSVTKWTTLTLLALPIGFTLLLYFTRDDKIDAGAALIVLVWYLATIYATYSGVRFIELMIPAFGIAFAVAAGRVYEWSSEYLAQELKWNRYLVNTLIFAIIALMLIQPVRSGEGTARGYIPSIDDSWWNTLTKINEESAPDAIINSWWDFGHWFKYVADRRVTADGTTQGTHVPRWLGLALVSPDEHESISVLRMLDCGSDAYPAPEGRYGAYGKILARLNNSMAAQQAVRDIILLTPQEARKYLADRSFTAQEQDSILNSTFCRAPEDYFITSGDMVGKAGVWAHFGLWNFTKAYIAQHSRQLPHDDAVADMQQKFGFTLEQADKLYYDAKALSNEGEINQFASPWPGYITQNWVSCKKANNGTALVCPIGIGISQTASGTGSIDSFTFNYSDPSASRITYGFYQNGQRVGFNSDGKPALMVLAKNTTLEDVKFNDSTSGGLAIVVDIPNSRILLADPLLAKSTFTQLFYLEGRYSKYYEKFDDQMGFSGSRVIVWKVKWDDAGWNEPVSSISGASTSAYITGPRNATGST